MYLLLIKPKTLHSDINIYIYIYNKKRFLNLQEFFFSCLKNCVLFYFPSGKAFGDVCFQSELVMSLTRPMAAWMFL